MANLPYPVRYSGYRILFSKNQAIDFGALRNAMEQLRPLYDAAAQEPFFLDDGVRDGDPVNLLMHVLQKGEFFLCMTQPLGTADNKVVGFAILRDISHGRFAYLEAWANPEFRGPEGKAAMDHHFKEIIEYAFTEWPKGLGLQKIKAEVCVANLPCLYTCDRLGFEPVGRSQLDQFHNGLAYDSVLLELLNPAIFRPVAESIKSDGLIEDAEPANVHAATSSAAVYAAPEPGEDGTAGDDGAAGSEPGHGGGELIAKLVAANAGKSS